MQTNIWGYIGAVVVAFAGTFCTAMAAGADWKTALWPAIVAALGAINGVRIPAKKEGGLV